MSSEDFLNTTWTLRIRKIVGQHLTKQQLVELNTTTTTTTTNCNIENDQTQLVNLYTEMAALKDKIACLEEATIDEETKRELNRIKNQIATIKAEGFAFSIGASYIPGHSYDSSVPFDPTKQSDAMGKFSYGASHGAVQNELKDALKQRFKGREEELALPPEAPVEEVDSGFDFTINDPAKCHEPIFDKKTKTYRQCGNYKFGESDYCHKHQKKTEKRDKLIAQWK